MMQREHGAARPRLDVRNLSVADIMSSPVISIGEDTSALTAAELMMKHRIEHLVAVNERGAVTGVLSDRDLKSAQPSLLLVKDDSMRNKALAVIHVRDVMAWHPHSVRPDDRVSEVLRQMLDLRIGCVPVIDRDGRLAGIVTGGDITELALALMRR